MLARKIVLVVAALLIPLACGDDGNEVQDEIEGTADCSQICSKYNECESDVDESGCVDLCEDTADETQAGEEAVENCEDCLDGKTCDQAESCWATCPVAVVPE